MDPTRWSLFSAEIDHNGLLGSLPCTWEKGINDKYMHVVEKDLRRHQADLTLTVRGEQSTWPSEFDSAFFQHPWADSRFQFCSIQTNAQKHPEEHRSTVIAVNAILKEQMHQYLRCLSQQCGWWLSYMADTRCTLCYSVPWDLNAFRHILQASSFLQHTFYSIIHQLQI